MWKELKQTIQNPQVRLSLILGILGAPPLYLSGIYAGRGQELLGVLCFIIYVVVYTLDALVTLTLLLKR